MPELPEVERAAGIIRRATRGKTIAQLHVLHPSLARRLGTRRAGMVRGRTVERVERRGKHQLLHLDDGSVLHVHFRMTGDWKVGRADAEFERFTRAAIDFTDGTRVALADPRALSSITLHAPGDDPLPELGPEPADASFTARSLRDALARRRTPIKSALLDQRVVAGLGNIYAAEALWDARIDPATPASALSLQRLGMLVRAIRRVLESAPAGRYWMNGAERDWNVYDREGEPCRRCGMAIERIQQAGRSTYYCPACQL